MVVSGNASTVSMYSAFIEKGFPFNRVSSIIEIGPRIPRAGPTLLSRKAERVRSAATSAGTKTGEGAFCPRQF